VDTIKMDLREIEWDGMNWIDLAPNRDQWRALVNTVMNLQVPWNAGKFLSSCTIGRFSRRAELHEWVSEWVSEPPVRKFAFVFLLWHYWYLLDRC
jgi:hypothetical protein